MLPVGLKQAKKLTPAPLLVIAVLVAYAPAPWSELVWDDLLIRDYWVPRFGDIASAFNPPADIPRFSYAYYRPLQILSYLLDARLFGTTSSAGPHLMNMLYHLLATLGVWGLARRLLIAHPQRAAGAWVAGALFAVHPIHTESVSWVAGRVDPMAATFLLAGLLLGLHWRDRRAWLALPGSAALFALALLCKESAITGLALLPLALLLAPPAVRSAVPQGATESELAASWRGRTLLASALAMLAWLAVAAGWFGLRQAVGVDAPAWRPAAPAERLDQLVGAAGWYLQKLLLPWPQSAVVSWSLVPGRAVSLAWIGTALAIGALGAWRALRRRDGLALFACGWLAITLSLPVWVAAFAQNNTPIAERYLYLPSIGLAIGAGGAFAWALGRGWRRASVGVAAVLLAACVVASIQRGMVWSNGVTLWTDATRQAPDLHLGWDNLGWVLWGGGDTEAALAAFERALQYPVHDQHEHARTWNAMAGIHLERGNLDAAEREFRRAVALYPALADGWYGLGSVYEARAIASHAAGAVAERDAAADKAAHFYRTAFERFAGHHRARLRLADLLVGQAARLTAEGRAGETAAMNREARQSLDDFFAGVAQDWRPDALQQASLDTGIDADQLRRKLASQ
jgi:tetratricopeptide (TPR) repeat protein